MSKRAYLLVTLLINGLVPWGLYVLLSDHMSSLAALTIATLVPLADNIIHFVKHRKLDGFGGLMLFTFLLTLAFVFIGGSEKILLVRESLVTACVGALFLGSLFFPRPFMYYLAVRFVPNNTFADNWAYGYFRFVMRLMTLVWGLILVMEAGVRIYLVFQLSVDTYLAVSNFILYGFIGAAILWTVVYRRYSAAKFLRLKESRL